MPTEYEYLSAAKRFREEAAKFRILTKAALDLLPGAEVEGPFQDYFNSSLESALQVGHWTEGTLRGAADECDRRARECRNYTSMKDLSSRTSVPDPGRPEWPWIEEG